MTHPTDHDDRDYVLLTGGTGLVGQYLVKELLAAGQRVALVVRPSKKLTANDRVELFMQRWEAEAGQSLVRPVVFEGDVCEPSLGLDEASQAWVGQHCGRVIHSAAVLTFHGTSRDADPWRTNFGGTRHVIELCERFDIQQLHYLSTAYVCGKRSDRVLETDLDQDQTFRNDYEHCKCEAEKLVQASNIPSKTIYRPAVIVGDSQTGYTVTYHGLFMYLRLIATLVPQQKRNADGVIETPLRLPMDGDEPRNLVPVDWVAEVVADLFLRPETHGRTYHLTPDTCSSAREVIEHCCEYFGSAGVEFVGAGAPRDADSEFAARFFENATMYQDYEVDDPQFDKAQLEEVAEHLTCPPVDQAMVFRFMEYGTEDRWGKRRAKPPEVPFWASEHLASIKSAAGKTEHLAAGSTIGVDLRGPGGGQWLLSRDEFNTIHATPGLSESAQFVLSADTNSLGHEPAAEIWETLFDEATANVVA